MIRLISICYEFLVMSYLLKIKLVASLKLAASCVFLILIIFNTNVLNAQNQRENLEAKRQRLLQQLENTNKKLQLNQQYQSAAEDQLEDLQDQIETREALINNLHEEILSTDSIISRTETVLLSLNDDIQRLKTEYSQMLRKAYRMKVPNNGLAFLMSSQNFDDAYKRWQYFKQYEKFKKRQVQLISETQIALAAKNTQLTQQKLQKEMLASTNENQKSTLANEKKSKDYLIDKLRGEQSKLSKELKTVEKKTAKLNAAISNLIYIEIESKRRAAEARARKTQEEADRLAREDSKRRKKQSQTGVSTEGVAEKPKTYEVLTESSENLALSSDFRGNKGKLPIPVSGNIVRSFGKQKVLDKVTAVSNGIDIRTVPHASVHAVFNGTVSVVSSIPGIGYVILIQHGNYYTVYSGLSAATVKKGETVSTKQTIGTVGINSVSNEPEVHFEVWLEKTLLNPAAWLAK
jgi:murein hydrolase activator